MIKRDTDVEVVSKATTNQRIGRSNVEMEPAKKMIWQGSFLRGKWEVVIHMRKIKMTIILG